MNDNPLSPPLAEEEMPAITVNENEVIIRVKSAGDSKMISKCIVQMYNEQYKTKGKQIMLRSIGAGAVNQAVKAVILANGSLIKWATVADIRPSFMDITDKMTSVVLKLNFTKL